LQTTSNLWYGLGMVDLTDPKFWADGAKIMIDAPQIVIPLLIAVGLGAWIARGKIEKAARNGLTEQKKAHEDYRQLAEAKAQEFSRKLADAEGKMAILQEQIKANESQPSVLATVHATSQVLGDLRVANNEFTQAVQKEIATSTPINSSLSLNTTRFVP